jgi:hypothetical protein
MKPRSHLLAIGALLALGAACSDSRAPDRAADQPSPSASEELADAVAKPGEPWRPEPMAEPITAENLLAAERFWPYRVALTVSKTVPNRVDPLSPGTTGVLIRVEPSGLPRLDFGYGGKYELPLEQTDLLERANQTRLGQMPKEEPNFIHAIKSRMLDAESEKPQRLEMQLVMARHGFLCVFADLAMPDFDELAEALAPLRDRRGVMTILFPQGEHDDLAVRERLRELDWPVPYLADFLSEPYTRTLLVEGTSFPYVMLQTAEGRVVFQGVWKQGLEQQIGSALDGAFGSRIATSN